MDPQGTYWAGRKIPTGQTKNGTRRKRYDLVRCDQDRCDGNRYTVKYLELVLDGWASIAYEPSPLNAAGFFYNYIEWRRWLYIVEVKRAGQWYFANCPARR